MNVRLHWSAAFHLAVPGRVGLVPNYSVLILVRLHHLVCDKVTELRKTFWCLVLSSEVHQWESGVIKNRVPEDALDDADGRVRRNFGFREVGLS